MKIKKTNEIDLFQMLLAIILAVMLVLALSCCTTTKHLERQTVTVDSSAIKSFEEKNRALKDENWLYLQRIRELQYNNFTFDSTKCPQIKIPTCPEMLDRDSVNNLINQLNNAIQGLNNKVKYYSDGSFEVSGKLIKANISKERLIDSINNYKKSVDSLTDIIYNTEVEKHVSSDFTKKDVKRRPAFLSWILFLIIGILGGQYLAHNKLNIFSLIFKK